MSNLTQRVLAVTLASTFVVGVNTKPARSNPAALAPALCATGVGCAVVGTVVIGGALYYVWEYGGGKRLAADAAGNIMRMLDDPEEEAERMGDTQSETVVAGTRKKATKLCETLAQGRTLQAVRHYRGNQWECIFY